jgi:hypothetical protein
MGWARMYHGGPPKSIEEEKKKGTKDGGIST